MPADPLTSFYFSVRFEDSTEAEGARFGEVSGLPAAIKIEDVREGGENRFKHTLPTGKTIGILKFKRGTAKDSELFRWCRDSLEQFTAVTPKNLIVSLLDKGDAPVISWQIVNAFPAQLLVSPLISK